MICHSCSISCQSALACQHHIPSHPMHCDLRAAECNSTLEIAAFHRLLFPKYQYLPNCVEIQHDRPRLKRFISSIWFILKRTLLFQMSGPKGPFQQICHNLGQAQGMIRVQMPVIKL